MGGDVRLHGIFVKKLLGLGVRIDGSRRLRLIPIVAAPAPTRLAGAQLLGIDQQVPGIGLAGIDGGQSAHLRCAGRRFGAPV